MNKIDRTVAIFIGGKERKMRFNINSVLELEAKIPERNVMLLMSRGIFSLDTLITALWIGLKYQDKFLDRKKVQAWTEQYLQEHDFQKLFALVYGAIGISGIIGDTSLFEDVIIKANSLDKEPEEAESEQENEKN